MIPLLAAPASGRRPIRWDVKDRVRYAVTYGDDGDIHQLSPAQLREPATRPPLSEFEIRISGYQWTVKITPWAPSGPDGSGPVTVLDVLDHLYGSMHTAVTREEYNRATPALRTSLSHAFAARIGAIWDPVSREVEMSKGLKRLDFLLGKDLFDGLRLDESLVPAENANVEVWVLDMRAGGQ